MKKGSGERTGEGKKKRKRKREARERERERSATLVRTKRRKVTVDYSVSKQTRAGPTSMARRSTPPSLNKDLVIIFYYVSRIL